MRIIEPGHIYKLHVLDRPVVKEGHNDGVNDTLVFVNRELGKEHPGYQTQEVLRALIDRTMHCDNCIRWAGNDKIIYHLRMALALHESRAIERKAEKGYYAAEQVSISDYDGHFQLIEDNISTPGEKVTDAEIYLRKDKNAKADGKPAQFCNMLKRSED